MSKDSREHKEDFDLWYGTHRFRTKNLNEYIRFLKNLLDEILLVLAYICRDIRNLENKIRYKPKIIVPPSISVRI